MRIQLFSDLHLERYPDYLPTPAPNVDVLVLAGDIGSYQAGSLLPDGDFGLARFSPLRPAAPWPRVLFVPGNHEYDRLEYGPTRERLRTTCERLGITWLDEQSLVWDGIRFIGSTLWSDFDALPHRTETQALQQRGKAFRAANFYLSKNTTLRDGRPMLAESLRDLALDAQAWLRRALAQPFEGKTVVVTHFAPSLRSADPRYGVTPGTAGFCNALDDLMAAADLWCHGHLHCQNDYVVETFKNGRPHACRVVSNPRGYFSKGEQVAFRDPFWIDLP